MSTFFPKHFHSSGNISAASQTTLTIPPTQIKIDTTSLESFSNVTLDVSSATDWDTTDPTNYSTAANRAGLDFYIYACIPTIGRTPKFLLSVNATYPTGYDADTSRKIGGFHCLCVNVGTISNHTLTGYLAGAILPASVWDLKHRALSGNNAGMVYDDATGKWYGIYLPSLSGSNAVSVYNATISDTINWFDAVDKCANSSCRLLKDDEFTACADGSPEGTNIYGSADPVTTGGHVNTASRRIISNIGCEDCAGVLWQWLDEQSYRFDAATVHTHALTASGEAETATSGNPSADVAPAWSWKAQTGGKGSLYTQGTYGTTKLLAGGAWYGAAYCGSRARHASNYPWNTGSDIGFRFCCDTKEL